MTDAVLRQLELLREIPRAPAKIDVSTLHQRLMDKGYQLTRRQLQRDLNSLSRIFDLQADERSSAFGWSWSKSAAAFDLPAMDAQTALMLKLVESFIPQLLPPNLAETMMPYFKKANAILKASPSSLMRHWSECVRVVPREMTLLPPKTDPKTSTVIYQALLEGKRFRAVYAPRSTEGDDAKEYEVNPLGVVVRGSLIYLVATLWNYTDVRQFALHRFKAPEILDQRATRVAGFQLDQYIAEGQFQYPVGPRIKLKAVFAREAAAHLYETPLSEDQEIKDIGSDRTQVCATVVDSQQLEWWLLGFGNAVRIVAPAGLARRVAAATAPV